MRSMSDLRAACAALPHSQETFPFGLDTLVWKVGLPDAAKMYALTGINADPLTLSLKVRPEDGDTLRAAHAAIVPGYHLNKRHWVTVTLDGSLPDDLVQELLAGSHALVLASFTRAQRAELGL
ncbi:MmcQ/YjbR family DNA-binding protein [Deinococcus sp. Arct2-2]|uniref:MmcQ/YjbR family DNA-binding protein n=1 Tax=Deinococcus sp. Arct2-2 TaxID=2568653 RepID=UPI0010A4FE2F|nr:MmcQ/YjbR family DNA-binding protein [Deinococcus sp. Arct2-2]THF71191.1 MmcQ/YjbR family DNA-binding protein [Deinococcus sp. Arct2-2]